MREGGSSPYYEVTQVLFVEMEIPGISCWGYYCIEVGKVQAKQKSISLRLSDVIWLF